MAPNVQKFCGLVVKHGLVSSKDVERLYREWRAAAPDQRDSLKSFASYLVKKGGVDANKLESLLVSHAKPAEYDVELVPVDLPTKRLGRRDALMIAAGAAGASVLWLVGTLVIRPKSPPVSE